MVYKILFSEVVKKQKKQIPKRDLFKIENIILSLQDNPRPIKCKKLVGGDQDYRLRYGDWRVLYSIDDRQKTVIVYGILNRKEAYR